MSTQNCLQIKFYFILLLLKNDQKNIEKYYCFFSLIRCMARVRTKTNGNLEIVEMQHNHGVLIARRKKGALKEIYAQKLKQQQAKS